MVIQAAKHVCNFFDQYQSDRNKNTVADCINYGISIGLSDRSRLKFDISCNLLKQLSGNKILIFRRLLRGNTESLSAQPYSLYTRFLKNDPAPRCEVASDYGRDDSCANSLSPTKSVASDRMYYYPSRISGVLCRVT